MRFIFWLIISGVSLSLCKVIKEALSQKNYSKALSGIGGILIVLLIASAVHTFVFKNY